MGYGERERVGVGRGVRDRDGVALPVEKTSDPFSLTEPVAGAVSVGGALTVSDTLVDALTLASGSESWTNSESGPE